MIEQAIDKIQQMVREERRMQVAVVDREPKDVYWLVDKDGKAERHVAEPKPRAYQASSLTGLCEQINHFNKTGISDFLMPSVFVGKGRVTVVLNEDERRHTISMNLTESAGFVFLREAQLNAKALDQKSAVWELRTRFRGEVSPANFIPDIRQLKFTSSSDGEQSVQTGRESLRRNVQAGVLMGDARDMAEEISIGCDVYEGLPELMNSQSFVVAVDVNLPEQKLIFKTLPGECENAMLVAHEHIVAFIRHACPGVEVFVDSAVG